MKKSEMNRAGKLTWSLLMMTSILASRCNGNSLSTSYKVLQLMDNLQWGWINWRTLHSIPGLPVFADATGSSSAGAVRLLQHWGRTRILLWYWLGKAFHLRGYEKWIRRNKRSNLQHNDASFQNAWRVSGFALSTWMPLSRTDGSSVWTRPCGSDKIPSQRQPWFPMLRIFFLELKQSYFMTQGFSQGLLTTVRWFKLRGQKTLATSPWTVTKGHFDGKPQAMWPYEMSGYWEALRGATRLLPTWIIRSCKKKHLWLMRNYQATVWLHDWDMKICCSIL